MTTNNTSYKRNQAPNPWRLPDPPENQDDQMTNFRHLASTGSAHYLTRYLGNPETTVVDGDHFITPVPTTDMTGLYYPDLLVAFNVDAASYYRQNSYIISEQGKPPDFVLEVASRATGRNDVRDKRVAYAALDIPEYWRFDETGQFHGTRLAGDRLVNGQYQPITIEQRPDGSLQGHSEILNLDLRWENGQLGWYDPNTGQHIPTLGDAEARVRELEDTIRRLRGE